MPELSVIICTYNRGNYLPSLLESLASQKLSRERFEVLIIDNNSTDNTSEISKEFITVHPTINTSYFLEEQAGLSYARNRGIKESKGEILIFIDDDAVAAENYLQAIADHFNDHPDTLAGGGKIIPAYESQSPAWMSPYLLPVVSALDMGNKIRNFPANKYPIGANMFFRKQVFERTGLFNIHLGRKGKGLLGGEEKDIFLKMGPGSGIVYLPEAEVSHIVPEERVQHSYITKMAFGVGLSEIIRVRQNGERPGKVIVKELFKWAATILLFFLYLVKLQYPKGRMLLVFRYFVSKGILSSFKNDS